MFLLFPIVSLFLFPFPLLCGSPSSYGVNLHQNHIRWSRVQATGSQAKLALKSHEMVQGRQAKPTLKSHQMVQGELSKWFRQVQTACSQAKLAVKSHQMIQGELSEWFRQVQAAGRQTKHTLKSHEMVQGKKTAGSQAKITSDDPGSSRVHTTGSQTKNHMRWSRPNSVVWNGPWASPKWPFTTVEYISYGISAVWNGVGQHFGWSPNFVPYEGFNCRWSRGQTNPKLGQIESQGLTLGSVLWKAKDLNQSTQKALRSSAFGY
ncbi:hypothetical protein DFH08DRAFT_825633 [Mycena albidolilacea]|uniref:Uncharacterized protein n=1 Tax=Mycena albidolilacea TaxID=1033008 RepID=A0AAD7E9Q4_9AGAR|nr:hypothetical protein DFH08DRAFT_825633 [Mycena albidolilacea]